MNETVDSLISPYISIRENEKISTAIDLFDKHTREILVFNEDEVFLGYLTKRFLARQSKVHLDSKVSKFIKSVPIIRKDTPLDEIARLLISKKIRSIPVEDNGEILGVLRDIDIIIDSIDFFENKKMEELMTPHPITVEPETTAAQLISISRNNNISRCPVVDGMGKLVGIVSPHDLKPILLTKLPGQTLGDRSEFKANPLEVAVKDLMSASVVTCKVDDPVRDAIEKLSIKDHKALIVINDENVPEGIITTHDLLETISVPPKTEGYYINVMGDVDEEDTETVLSMGAELVKKFGSMIGNSGQFYIHVKSIPKKKFRGYILYQIRSRITTDHGGTYVSRSEGYGLFGALAVALDRLEREIISETEKVQENRLKKKSTRYLLEELEELE